jgi:quercetin dioxygenase-like cupin family protein
MDDKAEYTYISDLEGLISEVPQDSIVSRTFFEGDQMKSILFGFAQGQELSEHTASKPAVLHFLSGEAEVTLGMDPVAAKGGTWIHMPVNLPHSIVAKTPVLMLLMLIG